MAISDKITSITNHLEDDYKALENLGASVTDRNIENIKDMAEQIYDNYPKTSFQEGTSITLENCNKGKLDFENGVVGIGQSSQESTQGYQLFNIDGFRSTGTFVKYNNGFTLVKGTNRVLRFVGMNIPAGTYTISYDLISSTLSTDDNFMLSIQKNDGTGFTNILSNLVMAPSGLNFTLNETASALYFFIASSENDDATITIDNVMLNTGSTAQPWEKYTGGYASPSPNWEQEVKCVAGKNKYNKNEATLGTISQSDGKTISPSGDVKYTPEYTEVNPNEQWTFSNANTSTIVLRVFFYDESKNYISTSVISGQPTGNSFTTLSNARYIRYQFNVSIDNNLQLEKGQATPYLPYNTIEEVVRGKNLYTNNSTGSNVWTVDYTDNVLTITAKYNTTGNNIFYFSMIPDEFLENGETYTISSTNVSGVVADLKLQLRNRDGSNANMSRDESVIYDSAYGLFVTGNVMGTGDTPIAKDQTAVIKDIMVEKGSIATTYQPYIFETKQLSLGNRKVYEGDYFWIDKTTGKKYQHHKMGEIRLTSDMQTGWRKPTEDTNNAVYCNNSNTQIYYFSSDTETQYLTHFIFKGRAQGYATALNKGIGAYAYYDNGNYYLYIVVSKTDFPNSTTFITFLDNNYVNVVYPLATETDEEITGTLAEQLEAWYNAKSIKGTTIIESNGDLPLIIKARALKGV